MKKLFVIFSVFALLSVSVSAQAYKRDIKLTKPRMNGTDVVQLQKTLLSLGFSQVEEADGYFGPKSQEALKEYQAYYGISNDGVFNKTTFNLMFNSSYQNLQYNLGIKEINCRKEDMLTFHKDINISDKEFAQHGEGATLTNYYKNDEVLYSKVVFLSSGGEGAYTLYPLANGDYIITYEYSYYEELFGPVARKEMTEAYFFLDNKMYVLEKGKFTANDSILSEEPIKELIKAAFKK